MNLVFTLSIFVIYSTLCLCQPDFSKEVQNGGSGSGAGKQKGARRRFNDGEIKLMRDNCKNSANGCGKQKAKWVAQRDMVRRHMIKNKPQNGKSDAQIDDQLNKMYKVKKALLSVQGLNDVEPADNGLYGGDMLLSTEQADRMIKRIQESDNSDPSTTAPIATPQSVDPATARPWNGGRRRNGGASGSDEDGHGKGKGKGSRSGRWKSSRDIRNRRAAALSIDSYAGNKWPTTTLNYYIDPNVFTSNEASKIRYALDTIQSRSCVKFSEQKVKPYIEYLKADESTDDGTCGWAYMGYQGDFNPVHINFASTICRPTLIGVIVHETLHTLGFSHEHTRFDRDRYLKINWENVDAQSIDVFDKDDPYDVNPYCVDYDYDSVMHYDCYVGSKSSKLPAATPKSNPDYWLPRIGNAVKPSDKDILLLNKLYCTPASCKDVNPYCGFSCGGCTDKFAKSCPKSCNQCSITV